MRIAVPIAGDTLCAHFGHCDHFAILDVNENGEVSERRDKTPPLHEPGVLPQWLAANRVDCVIAGGMGARAQALFRDSGIAVVTGAPADRPETLAAAYVRCTLATGDNSCDH